MRASCRGCVHYRGTSTSEFDKCCHYLLDTGERRPCPAESCTVKTTGRRKRRQAPMRVKV